MSVTEERTATTEYLAGKVLPKETIAGWVEQFHRDGFLHIPNVLPPDWCAELREDLEAALVERGRGDGPVAIAERLFERSNANLRLFDLEPIVSFAEALITGPCHVIHNNSFKSFTGGGGITGWHQDDATHMLVTHGEPPTNIRLPVLLFTANYILTDAPTPEYGPMQVVAGSHLLGQGPPAKMEGSPWEDRLVNCCGPAGSVTMFNCQVWHRGAPNTSDRIRYMTQISYARRIIGHKYYPFMNYQMPEHVYANADERLKRLLGFLPHGAYG
jgi:ectoine hydroxylase-related dioxygenase (phytanoyl-CoA dioxygenase family)